jgi:hypothetical protein
MSVLLTSDTYINGVLTTSGTTVSLGYIPEYNLVYEGSGTWVSIPNVVPNTVANQNLFQAESIAVTPHQGMFRRNGGASVSTGATSVGTQYYKIEAEAPFLRVRLHFFGKETTACAGITAVIAATEVASNSNVTNAVVPIVSGVQSNVAQSASSPYGFRPVTWAGATSCTIPAGTAAAPSVVSSDWIECTSVTPTTGTRPFLLVRRFADPVTNSSTVSFGSTTYNTSWLNAASQAYYRQYFPLNLATSNGVSTPTNVPSSTAISGGAWVGVEFDYGIPARSILSIGDSITEGGGYQLYGYDNWTTRAVSTKSTPSSPIVAFNGGLSNQTQTAFSQELTNVLATGVVPTDIIIPNWSINNTSPANSTTMYHTNIAKSQIMNAINQAKAIGAKVYIWTSYHRSTYTGTPTALAAFDDLQSWTRSTFADGNGMATIVDVAANWVDATMLGADFTHPTPVGLQYMADTLSAKL